MIPSSYYQQCGCWSCRKCLHQAFCIADGTSRPPVPNSSYQFDSFREAAWDDLEKWDAAHKVDTFGFCEEWEGLYYSARLSGS